MPDARQLAAKVLSIVERDCDQWSRGDCQVLLTLYTPGSPRNAMVQLIAFMDDMRQRHPELTDFYAGAERLVRLQLASRVDWNQLYNRPTRVTWLARFKARNTEATFVKDVRNQLDQSRTRGG